MLKRIINKLFCYNAYAVGIREVSDDSEGMDFSQNPFHMLMPTENEWYADSFCFDDDGVYYLFMEIMGRNGGKGTLGVASYTPGKGFSSVTEILREGFHLSYPNVFKYGNDYYMLPETNEAKQIRLYKAVEFPYKWELHKVLLDDGRRYVDTSYYQLSESRYFLFSHDMTDRVNEEVDEGSVIKCFCLDMESLELTSVDWIRDAVNDRPGGNVLSIGGKSYRVLQDCSRVYGEKLKLYEIVRLDDAKCEYQEIFAGEITADRIPTNIKRKYERIHTLTMNGNLEAVDLLYNRFYPTKPLKKLKQYLGR